LIEAIKPEGKRRIVSLDEAMRRADAYEMPLIEKAPVRKNIESCLRISDLWIESPAPEEMFTFEGNMKRLKEKRYHRNMTPTEYTYLMLTYFEKKSTPEHSVFASKLFLRHEWLAMAWRVEEDTLICYINPVGIIPKDESSNEYEVAQRGFSCYKAYQFVVRGYGDFLQRKFPLSEALGNVQDFSKKIYGVPFEDLTPYSHEYHGKNEPTINLPPQGRLEPVYFVAGTPFSLSSMRNDAGSRGVIRL